MSSQKYVSPLQLEIRSSRRLFIVLLFLHGLALVSLAMLVPLELTKTQVGIAAFFVFISGIVTIRHHALKKSLNSIVEIRWDDNDSWDITTRMGRSQRVKLLSDSYVSSSMVILLFKRPRKSSSFARLFPLSLILLRDNTNANLFRHLRVRLKVQRSESVNT